MSLTESTILIKPFKYTRALRTYLTSKIKGFTVNTNLRNYARNPKGQCITLAQLVLYCKNHQVRPYRQIPSNMYYNQHFRTYWLKNPQGSFDQCVALWHKAKDQNLVPDNCK